MGPDFDEAGFKKARGFLMMFSTLIIVLCYFSVDLTSISILGNSIQFTENREKAWLALSIANSYLFFRYIQQFPEGKWRPDAEMRGVFERLLILLCAKVYHRKLIKKVNLERGTEAHHVVSIYPVGNFDTVDGFNYSYEKAARYELAFDISYTIDRGGAELDSGSGVSAAITPHPVLIWLSKMLAFIKGVALKPWFLEHMFPVVYACVAVCLALLKWWQMNQVVYVAFKNSFNQLLMAL